MLGLGSGSGFGLVRVRVGVRARVRVRFAPARAVLSERGHGELVNRALHENKIGREQVGSGALVETGHSRRALVRVRVRVKVRVRVRVGVRVRLGVGVRVSR